MRLVFLFLALLCVAIGVVFGALNPQTVQIDFYWWTVSASLGTTFLAAGLAGLLLGGACVTVGVVWPLRRRLARARVPSSPSPSPSPDDATPSLAHGLVDPGRRSR